MIPVYKAVFRGTVVFGSSKSYEQAEKLVMSKLEQVWKNDLAFKPELVFQPETKSVTLPQKPNQYSEKTFLNTVNFLQTICQFAISGIAYCWLLDDQGVRKYACHEPNNEKTTVRQFHIARSLMDSNPEEAEEILTQVIKTTPSHAQAWALRGLCKVKKHHYLEAISDFEESIQAQDNYAQSHHGLALCHIALQNYEKAIHHATEAMKHSIPWMEIFWHARRIKGEALLGAGFPEKSLIELESFLSRDFHEDDKNRNWLSYSYILAAYAYQNLELKHKADLALNHAEKHKSPPSIPLGNLIELIREQSLHPLPEWSLGTTIDEKVDTIHEEPVAFTSN